MSEANFWRRVRGALHDPPRTLCRKLSDAFTAGTPDAYYVVRGTVGFLELKYKADWPVRVTTPVRPGITVEQRRYLETLVAAKAPAFVFIGIGRDFWALCDPRRLPHEDALSQESLRNGHYGVVGNRLRSLIGVLERDAEDRRKGR